MKDSKVFYALNRLSSKERLRFAKYLESPYFNTDPNLVELYKSILSLEKKIEKDQIDKKDLWASVRPDEPFNDTRFRKYTSTLLKHIEGFLYQEYTSQDKGHEYAFVLDALNERRMDRLYSSVLRSGRDAINKAPVKDSKYYQRTYAIEKRFYELTDKERQRGVAANTRDIADALDYFYISEKLRLHNSVLGRNFYLDGGYSLRLVDEIIEHVEKENLFHVPAIEIYYRLANTYKNPDDQENFELLFKRIKESHDLFSPDELEEVYRGVLNFFVRGANSGKTEALISLVDIYKYMLEREVFNSVGELSPWAFKNAILAGLRTEQFDWVLNTLENYSEKLPKDYKENALAFNYAQVYFYRKEFGKVLEYLQQVEYQDPTYALNSRNLLVAVYYELGQLDSLDSTINAFRTYLKRQKNLSEKLKRYYRDLLKITYKLASLTSKDIEKIKKIETYLQENTSVASIQWLISKVEELKAGNRKW